jgi:hypothetical protein
MSDVMDELRALDPERDGSSGAPPLGWLRALLDTEPDPPRRRFGRRAAGARRSPRSPRRRPIAVAVALACLAALAAIAIAVLGGSASDPRRDALVPANGPAIVHVVVDALEPGPTIQTGEARSRGKLDGPVERWSTAEDRRWRELMPLDPIGGARGGTIDLTFSDGLLRKRESWSRKVHVQRLGGRARRNQGSNWALVVGLAPIAHSEAGLRFVMGVADPRAFIEQMVRNGDLRAAGAMVRDGRRLLRFTGASGASGTQHGGSRPATRATYLLDPNTYAPVEVETRYDLLALGQRRRPRFVNHSTLRFPVYETLPLNAETERLLTLGGPTR